MAMTNLTINGRKVSALAGGTVLEAARQAGIEIPTLCDHPALAPIGACRMCLVEIKGQRTLQPACTFPVTEGMEVQTESEQVVAARKFVLDLLFSERNHYCMYCEMTGDCELQALAYRYKIDHWVYPTYTKRFPVDASRTYFLMDHNRCILCRRCVRACAELAANHTLGLRQRGAQTMVHADMNAPFGDSSCVSCGTCLQVCPTGALVDKRSAFMGRDVETERIKSVCSQCSVGCGMEIVTRAGSVLRLEGDWDAEVNHGLLCQAGRFDPLYDARQRVTHPMIREKGDLRRVDWDTAMRTAAKAMKSGKKTAVLTSTRATNEAIYLTTKLFAASQISLLSEAAPKVVGKLGSLTDIRGSDLILLVGADPANEQPVVSFLVKRAVDQGARLVVVDGQDNGLAPFAFKNISPSEMGAAVEIASRAEHPVVLFGSAVTDKGVKALAKLQGKASFVAIEPGVNTRAAAGLGLGNGGLDPSVEALFVLLGEQQPDDALMKAIGRKPVVIVLASFESPLTQRADVVLPMAIWSERKGTLTNTEGRIQRVAKAVEPSGEAKADWEILSHLAATMGKKLSASFDDIAAQAAKAIRSV